MISPGEPTIISFGVTKRGHNLENIPGRGLHAELGQKNYITGTVLLPGFKGRSDGYFGVQYQGNTEGIEVYSGRRIGRQLMKVHILGHYTCSR